MLSATRVILFPTKLENSLSFIMTGSKNGNETEAKSPRESGEDSEDESEILEESPCGRWSKRRQEVGGSLKELFVAFRGGMCC